MPKESSIFTAECAALSEALLDIALNIQITISTSSLIPIVHCKVLLVIILKLKKIITFFKLKKSTQK